MSIQAVGWVLDHSESRGFARLVLISLANHADERNRCFPSMRCIAREAGVSLGSVPAQVEKLVGLGELVVLSPGNQRKSARYELVIHSVQEMNAKGGTTERSVHSGAARSVQSRGEQNHQQPSGTVRAAEPPVSDPKGEMAKVMHANFRKEAS